MAALGIPTSLNPRALVAAFLVAWVAIPPVLAADPPLKVGSPLTSPGRSGSIVNAPLFAMDGDGDALLAWSNDDSKLVTQRIDAGGRLVGTPAVHPITAIRNDEYHALDMGVSGAWTALVYDGSRLLARTSIPGTAAKSLVVTNQDPEKGVDVGVDAAGGFWSCWSKGGKVYLRRTRAGELPLQAFPIALDSNPDQRHCKLAVNARGNGVLVYERTYDNQLWAQRISANGGLNGAPVLVNPTFAGDPEEAVVAMDERGNFVVAWYVSSPAWSVVAQRFAPRVGRVGQPIVLSTGPELRAGPSVAMAADGSFIVAWEENVLDADETEGQRNTDVRARRFASDGTPDGDSFIASSSAAGDNALPTVRADVDGDFAIAWNKIGDFLSSTSYVQRFRGNAAVDLTVTQADFPDPVAAGQPLEYRISVSNLTPPTTPYGIPAVDSQVGAAHTVRVSYSAPGTGSGTNWTCSIRVLNSTTCTYKAALRTGKTAAPLSVKLNAPTRTILTSNTADVRPAQIDPNVTNNREIESTSVD